jgi:hypothetical protein
MGRYDVIDEAKQALISNIITWSNLVSCLQGCFGFAGPDMLDALIRVRRNVHLLAQGDPMAAHVQQVLLTALDLTIAWYHQQYTPHYRKLVEDPIDVLVQEMRDRIWVLMSLL